MRAARNLNTAPSRWATTLQPFPDANASGFTILSVSTVPQPLGSRPGERTGSSPAPSRAQHPTNDVAPRDEADQDAVPHHREPVHVLVDHHGGHIRYRLVVRNT